MGGSEGEVSVEEWEKRGNSYEGREARRFLERGKEKRSGTIEVAVEGEEIRAIGRRKKRQWRRIEKGIE